MSGDESFLEYVRDQLRARPGCAFKRMFGGYGIYRSGVFFGIVFKGRLYFKTDAASRPDYESRGMEPFRPGPRTTLKSFYEVPIDVLEDAALLTEWAERAAAVNAVRRRARGKILRALLIGTILCGPALPRAAAAGGDVAAAPDIWKDEPAASAPPGGPRLRRPRRTRLFWQLDLWTKDAAFREDEQVVDDFLDSVVANGYDSAQGTIRVSGGLGFRFGLFLPVDGIEIGPSFGYVLGPVERTTVEAKSATFGDAGVTERNETSFYRFLVEAVKQVPVGRRVDFRLRGGIGVAVGRIALKDRYTGAFVTVNGLPATVESSNHWTGVTWELMPSLLLKRGALNYEFGVGFAGFPSMPEQARFSRFSWSPIGLRFGIEFK